MTTTATVSTALDFTKLEGLMSERANARAKLTELESAIAAVMSRPAPSAAAKPAAKTGSKKGNHRGRPKGSKNKPKAEAAPAPAPKAAAKTRGRPKGKPSDRVIKFLQTNPTISREQFAEVSKAQNPNAVIARMQFGGTLVQAGNDDTFKLATAAA